MKKSWSSNGRVSSLCSEMQQKYPCQDSPRGWKLWRRLDQRDKNWREEYWPCEDELFSIKYRKPGENNLGKVGKFLKFATMFSA